jgi:dUTP pyrophosphatase
MPESHKHLDFDLLDKQFGVRTEKHRLPVDVRIMRVNAAAVLPEYAHEGDSGMDLRAMEGVTLWPGRATKIATGIALSLPDGYEAQIRPRSGLTVKGVQCGWGTCDAGYRGELSAVLTFVNESQSEWFNIDAGDRICQLVIVPVPRIQWSEVFSADALGETARNTNGWGSSGVK